MLCLDIPLDHRLIRTQTIKSPPCPLPDHGKSHVDILGDFGRQLIEKDDCDVSWAELDFTLELARPESTGGLVIILEQPHPSQEYQYGFVQEERRCKTVAAVKDLIEATSHNQITTNMVSIFDAMPFVKDPYNGNVFHKEAQRTFLEAIQAKHPQLVLSCFRIHTPYPRLQELNGKGIGKGLVGDTLQTPGKSSQTLQISAFHPSYAINRIPFEGCFRRLLHLEFSQAFRRLAGNWKEEAWMAVLREDCRETAKLYNGMSSFVDL